ncbi:MAG: Mth938-like domain-containing protein [Litoreibacter sp.]
MRLNEVSFDSAVRPVDSYGPGFFRVAGEVIQGNALLLPDAISPWSGFDDLSAILAVADQIDVVFFGMGPEIAHIPETVRDTLEAAGLGVELMSTPTACRTYNVLLSEGRRIAAALLAMPDR